ncbi:helix-turn-helix transcriptional regulator [Lactobacillus halodurans]|uniref:Helix-turn-helix transcriptional regulator n=1 Tax=Companilactobacillus halodurans TaxID=2584183 RepID=A0A5P0ZN67_9LACO|nr:helix-turn-helix transcriptional regulator [Companilactobacillus halodurans]MQS75664.1 helix-turn-helix transcriptional regulator [Companilactobacillus halodurans]
MNNTNKLKEIRENKDMKQIDLALMLGVSQRTISAWETGRRTPSPKFMQQIEDIFNVPKEDIFFTAFSYKM